MNCFVGRRVSQDHPAGLDRARRVLSPPLCTDQTGYTRQTARLVKLRPRIIRLTRRRVPRSSLREEERECEERAVNTLEWAIMRLLDLQHAPRNDRKAH